jgi:hypothetical protein
MKYKAFMWFWFSLLALCSVIVGVLALMGRANAEVRFWTKSPIETVAGKVAWILGSATFLAVFLILAFRERRKEATRRQLNEAVDQESDTSDSSDDWIF